MTPGVTHNNEEDEGWTYHTSSPPSRCQLTAARAPRWARCPGWPLCHHPAARRRPYRHAEGAAVCSAALWSSDPGGEWRKDQVGRTMRGEKAKEVMLALVCTGSLTVGLKRTHARSFPRSLSLFAFWNSPPLLTLSMVALALSLSLSLSFLMAVAAGCSAEELLWIAEIWKDFG